MLSVVFVAILCAGYSLAYTGPIFIREGSIHGVKYLTGGVGLDEKAVMQKMAKGIYNLQFVFAEMSGPYLTNVKVEIRGKDGKKLVDISTDGPWFFARLSNGQYKITVTHTGNSKVQQLNVGKNFQKVIFNFKGKGR